LLAFKGASEAVVASVNPARTSGALTGPSFYIVLDRLHETLEGRIRRWNASEPSKLDRQKLTPEKTRIIKEVAAGIAHLHKNLIIHRDIKPANVAFAPITDQVKIFDMGISRRLPGDDRDQLYRMTGYTGSQRYMAPKPYGLSADVYSWALLAVETFSQKTAFKGYTSQAHKKAVCHQYVRPNLKSVPRHIGRIVKASWDQQPQRRSSIETVCDKLSQEKKSYLWPKIV
jgi:serine/threonine protein kinase